MHPKPDTLGELLETEYPRDDSTPGKCHRCDAPACCRLVVEVRTTPDRVNARTKSVSRLLCAACAVDKFTDYSEDICGGW